MSFLQNTHIYLGESRGGRATSPLVGVHFPNTHHLHIRGWARPRLEISTAGTPWVGSSASQLKVGKWAQLLGWEMGASQRGKCPVYCWEFSQSKCSQIPPPQEREGEQLRQRSQPGWTVLLLLFQLFYRCKHFQMKIRGRAVNTERKANFREVFCCYQPNSGKETSRGNLISPSLFLVEGGQETTEGNKGYLCGRWTHLSAMFSLEGSRERAAWWCFCFQPHPKAPVNPSYFPTPQEEEGVFLGTQIYSGPHVLAG